MRILLWILNSLLAVVFLFSGGSKIVQSREAVVASGQLWAEMFPGPVVTLIGVLEVLGALGLILPLATGIARILTPIAAVCLVLTMIGAMITHLSLGEPVVGNIVLGVLAAASAVLSFRRIHDLRSASASATG